MRSRVISCGVNPAPSRRRGCTVRRTSRKQPGIAQRRIPPHRASRVAARRGVIPIAEVAPASGVVGRHRLSENVWYRIQAAAWSGLGRMASGA
jgi:hypothetical protein